MRSKSVFSLLAIFLSTTIVAEDFSKPYSSPCTERENVFEFTENPQCRFVGDDKYEITFAVKGFCDVTVGIVDEKGIVVRHLGSGVLGANAPAPFQKNALKQKLYWDGKDDLDVYHKTPQNLTVRVMLGFKPEFDKRLGGTSPKNLPGTRTLGLAADPGGVTIFTTGHRQRIFVRRFDLNGNYVATLSPPPANLPENKLGGLTYVEYEPGKRAVQALELGETVTDHQRFLPMSGGKLVETQPTVVGDRIYYLNSGIYGAPSTLFAIRTDGSTDLPDAKGRPFSASRGHSSPRLAASSDDKWLYMTKDGEKGALHHVLRYSLETHKPTGAFVGTGDKPGNDNAHLNGPAAVDCDGQGRVYVCDYGNNRVQIFSPEGKHLKTVAIDRPDFICVDRKTGAFYVQHQGRIQGKSVSRVTKFESGDNPREVFQKDGIFDGMALDYWSPKPRLWVSGCKSSPFASTIKTDGNNVVTVWEDDRKTLVKVLDFDEAMKKEDGDAHAGRWSSGALGQKTVCDPTRETVYFGNRGGKVFELKTGKYVGRYTANAYAWDDIAFAKRGYMHLHFNPTFYFPGVGRVDPGQATIQPSKADEGEAAFYPEVPYDYGVEKPAATNQNGWASSPPNAKAARKVSNSASARTCAVIWPSNRKFITFPKWTTLAKRPFPPAPNPVALAAST